MEEKTVKLHHDTANGISIEGEEFKCDAEGNVTVPESMAAHLVESFGFKAITKAKPEGKAKK